MLALLKKRPNYSSLSKKNPFFWSDRGFLFIFLIFEVFITGMGSEAMSLSIKHT